MENNPHPPRLFLRHPPPKRPTSYPPELALPSVTAGTLAAELVLKSLLSPQHTWCGIITPPCHKKECAMLTQWKAHYPAVMKRKMCNEPATPSDNIYLKINWQLSHENHHLSEEKCEELTKEWLKARYKKAKREWEHEIRSYPPISAHP